MTDSYRYNAHRPESFSDGEASFVKTFPLFQWSNGWPTNKRQIVAGWVAAQGKYGELFDTAMQSAGYKTFQKSQDGVLNTYWEVESMDMFVVCQGVDTVNYMKANAIRHGVGYGLHSLGFKSDGRENIDGKLRAVIFPTKLVEAGYVQPCTITAGRMTAIKIVQAFIQHYKVLDWMADYAKSKAGDAADPGYPAYYAVALNIGPGEEQSYTNSETGEKSTNIPPISGLPAKFGEDKKAAVAWAKNRLIRRQDGAYLDVLAAIESDLDDAGLTLMDNVLTWAQEFSDRWTRDGDTFKKNGAGGGKPTTTPVPVGVALNGRNAPQPVTSADTGDDSDEPNIEVPF